VKVSGKYIALLCCAVVVGAMAAALLSTPKAISTDDSFNNSGASSVSEQRTAQQVAAQATPRTGGGDKPKQHFSSLDTLMSASDAAGARAAWREARKQLLNHSNGAEAVEALKAALDSGRDQVLDASLRVSVDGELKEAPSVRVYALDLLAQLDSAEAAEYARTILESSTSSDEWAIAMRNYAWGIDNAGSDPFLREKVFELLTNEAWISQPTSGFLEAFDFVPYTRDAALVAPLVTLAKPEQPTSIRRAAFLALARLHSQDTTVGLEGVSKAEALEPFSPVRADAMSRADFTRTHDVALVRSYLASETVDPRELAIFADTFPQGGQFAGPALATRFEPQQFATLARRDAAALSIIEGWMQDPALEFRRTELLKIYERLVRLRESAVAGGYL
jgi:hypothetical protein